MLTGRGLCGGVRFETTGQPGPVVYCHCSMCQRFVVRHQRIGAVRGISHRLRMRVGQRIRIISGQPPHILFSMRIAAVWDFRRPPLHPPRETGNAR